MTCPICNSDLRIYYALARQVMCCYCPSSACILNERDVEGEGDSSDEALSQLLGKALRFERPLKTLNDLKAFKDSTKHG